VSEVEPNLKANKAECGCGCGIFGTLRVKPWRSNGVTCVRRGCVCRQCVGRASKMGGQKNQQRKGAKEIAGVTGRNHEQNDRFAFRWENKRDSRYARQVFTAFEAMQKIDEQLRPLGDTRPFLFRADKAGSPYGLVVFRGDQLREMWEAIGIQNGWL
jgi:hypothetical protein